MFAMSKAVNIKQSVQGGQSYSVPGLEFGDEKCILLTETGNTNWRGRLNTLDLLFKVGCFVK
jgi:hypothetical protein